ncbi:MAG: type II toxin-antitoxin system RelE/ParE family toxin [Saprospiraceae bacterium]|nr:type II toxin-antitoxin system RelE/ParE family toxin [Saprospiraceae bacterium]
MRLVITRKAELDLIGILQYTIAAFGPVQAQKYSVLVDEGLSLILKSPGPGHKRRDIPANLLVFPVGQHLLIYRLDTIQRIVVVRVLHSRMDFSDRI